MSLNNNSYRRIPFSSETPKDELYTFSIVPDLVTKCESYKDDMFMCRTVGILHSVEGRFFLTDLDVPTLQYEEPKIRITMVFLKDPVKSTIIPYPVQIFGTLKWKKGPVIFARIIQVFNSAMALRVRDTLSSVTKLHLARDEEDIFDESIPDMNDTFVLDST